MAGKKSDQGKQENKAAIREPYLRYLPENPQNSKPVLTKTANLFRMLNMVLALVCMVLLSLVIFKTLDWLIFTEKEVISIQDGSSAGCMFKASELADY